MNGGNSVSDTVKIEFHHFQEATTWIVDVKLPHKKNIIKGFKIKIIQGNEKAIVFNAQVDGALE